MKIIHQLFGVLDGGSSILACITAVLSSYVVTLVAAKGSLFNATRRWLIERTLWAQALPMWGEPLPPHPLMCRLCLGAWVSLAFSLIYSCNWLIVWAGAYFMATQERS